MRTFAQSALWESVLTGADIVQVEPDIFTVRTYEPTCNEYDTDFGFIYEWVACNPVYNRVIWGYSTKRYATFSAEAILSTAEGPLLDLACGSLAFTAPTYVQFPQRALICSDQSLKMLKMAKARLYRIHGKVPDHVVLLLADAKRLPFRDASFHNVICLNLLHCIPDVPAVLQGLNRIVGKGAGLYFTTLVQGKRLADRYLNGLARAHKLVSRPLPELAGMFQQYHFQVQHELSGNLAFIRASSANRVRDGN